MSARMLLDSLYFSIDVGSKVISETMLNLVSIFSNDFVSFGSRLDSLLALFWEPLEGLGASLCRQVGAKGGPKRMPKGVLAPKSLQVASGTSFLTIWEALGPLLGRFLGGLGGSLGRQVGAKGVQQGCQTRLWRPNRCKSPVRFHF